MQVREDQVWWSLPRERERLSHSFGGDNVITAGFKCAAHEAKIDERVVHDEDSDMFGWPRQVLGGRS